jgi:spore germination protein
VIAIINRPRDKISTAQAAIAVSSITIGAGIITMVRPAARIMNSPDIWLSVIIGGLISITLGIILVKLSQRFPGKTFFQFNQIIVGKFTGRIFSMITIAYYILISGFEARMLSELVRTYLLIRTPIQIVIIAFICVGTYLTVGGINSIVRAFELYFPIITILLFGIMLLGFQHFEPDNLRPILGKGFSNVLKGVQATILVYTGFEIMMTLTAFMKEPGKAVKAVIVGTGIPILFYTFISIVVIGVLTVDEVKTLTWPTASLVNYIEYSGGFVENFQVFFLIVWILAIYSTFVASHYMASLGMGQIVSKDFSVFTYILNPIIYIVAIVPQNLDEVFKLGDLAGYMGLFASVIVPILLFVIVLIRKKGYKRKVLKNDENKT